MHKNKSTISIFIEEATAGTCLFSLLPKVIEQKVRFKKRVEVYYFYSTCGGRAILKIAAVFLSVKAEEADFRMLDLIDEDGLMIRLKNRYMDIGEIQQGMLKNNPFFSEVLGNEDIRPKFKSFIKKQIDEVGGDQRHSLWLAIFLIHVVLWKVKEKQDLQDFELALLLYKRIGSGEIIKYAKKYSLQVYVMNHCNFDLRQFILKVVGKNKYIIRSVVFYLKQQLNRILGSGKNNVSCELKKSFAENITAEYYGQLNLDRLDLISDIFFFQNSDLKGEDILLAFHLDRDPVDDEKIEKIKKHKLNVVALRPEATRIPSVEVFYHFKHKTDLNLNGIHKQAGGTLFERSWLKGQCHNYSADFHYWYDFFSQVNTKLYITWCSFGGLHCAIGDALQSLGGALCLYQRSFLEFPCHETAVFSDVYFGYSKMTADVERKSQSEIPYYVVTGYLGDYRFKAVESKSCEVRKILQKNGAKHIAAYFDENSRADHRLHTGHDLMRKNYAFLLEKVLECPWFGLVIKPKAPRTLRNRLGPLAPLLEQALSTGRCYLFEKGALHGAYPPAVAAKAADVAIHGHLSAVSAGLEAALAGTPTLLYDAEGWPISKFFKLNEGKVAFKDWECLWQLCHDHWFSKGGVPAFGDWSDILDDLDPFRDGLASARAGQYLKWLLDGFKEKLPRETVLENAADRYREKWGADKVIRVNC